ncbi:hypothetical protein MSG28_009742 [Choristoneura fumiferana]|uniref:Uncharacterized protein n=1 Tax=Choristoneura fumiferana TaxID=7141 RepID=A0ACC0JCE8_CHOFU|nr:hypothetical protein MSG28_009742 [Choristoneura fumiferana]
MNLMFVFLLLSSVYVESQCCSVTEVSTLLKGCKYLKGLSETSSGGTTINDDNCGLLVPVLEFLTEPLFQYPQADLNKFYTLIMVETDIPLHTKEQFFLHIVKTNIRGSALRSNSSKTTEGDDLKSYFPPTPPPGTGTYRYISALYEQPDGNFFPDVPFFRVFFNLGEWLSDKNICGPNTFYTLFLLDPDVPLHSEGEFFVHMLKSNIPGSALAAKKNHTTGDVYIPFIPPTPPPALGPHRYISLLYEQANDSFRPDDVPSPATQADRLLEGCSYLRGLSETSVGGTRVDDYNCGLVVPVTEFASEPLFQYPWAVPEKFYTLFVVDPDVPNYAVGEFFLHMLKSNIPGSELKFKNNGTIKGDEYQPYFPPMPPAGSGLHRYISVLYQQADGNFRPDVPLELDCSVECYKLKMDLIFVFLFLSSTVYGETLQCSVTEVKSLLEGCDRLTGLNVTSVGGTIVNDHNCDVLLPKQVFFEEPLFQYALADAKKFYTLLMIDPDAPPQLDGEFFLHMLKSNIPVRTTQATYKPPTPPHGTGAHRYISLLYEQADGNNFLPAVPQSRSRFELADWLRGKNLCGPVANTKLLDRFGVCARRPEILAGLDETN